MAIVFDATVGGANANSYATVAEYAQYRENLGLAALTESAAQVALIRATAWVDFQYASLWYTNSKDDDDQALHWPQDCDDYDDDEIPNPVKVAVYQYAIKAADQTTLDPVQDTNTQSQRLEGLGSQSFFSRNRDGSLPDAFKFIDTILYPVINGRSGGMRILNLERV